MKKTKIGNKPDSEPVDDETLSWSLAFVGPFTFIAEVEHISLS